MNEQSDFESLFLGFYLYVDDLWLERTAWYRRNAVIRKEGIVMAADFA